MFFLVNMLYYIVLIIIFIIILYIILVFLFLLYYILNMKKISNYYNIYINDISFKDITIKSLNIWNEKIYGINDKKIKIFFLRDIYYKAFFKYLNTCESTGVTLLINFFNINFFNIILINTKYNNTLTNTLTHELGHVLGIGIHQKWKNNIIIKKGKKYLDKSKFDTIRIYYDFKKKYIPLSEDGFHWNDYTFKKEIMGPYYSIDRKITNLTLYTLKDLGYKLKK
jgi:hypothetical protein